MKLIPIVYILISLFSLSACSKNSRAATIYPEDPYIISALMPHWESFYYDYSSIATNLYGCV
jgi:hypothetical protein